MLWSEGQQRPEAWLAFIEGIPGGRSDAARLALPAKRQTKALNRRLARRA
jgi:hypothetical protein